MVRLLRRYNVYFLSVSLLSFVANVFLWFLHSHGISSFVGLWVPSILVLGVGVGLVTIATATPGGSN